MPTLEWIGKSKVINHHQDVPIKILNKGYTYNADTSDNMIIHGDNLIALKALLPKYEGLIDCIYIDPPYNTAHSTNNNQRWVYNDNVDDPKIQKWFKQVVGDAGEDLSRDDKWLCMMYPRLKLLHKLLSNNGIIFISIDENELYNLKYICDEIFGISNYIGLLSVEVNPKGRKNSDYISLSNDYCLIYSKDKKNNKFIENIPKDKKDLSLDENGRLVHNSGKRVLVGENSFNKEVKNFNSDKHYVVYYNKDTNDIIIEKETSLTKCNENYIKDGFERYYSYYDGKFIENTYTKDKLLDLFEEEALEFKNNKIYEKNFSNSIRIKSILSNKNYKTYDNNGNIVDYKLDVKTTSANQELKNIFATTKTVFNNPKNRFFIQLLITLIDKKDALILDSFAGSGTTAHAVLKQNSIDDGTRKFILIETLDYAETITAERIKKVIDGYGKGDKFVKGLKGDFSFYELGEDIFDNDGNLNENIPLIEMKKYIYYTETKKELKTNDNFGEYFLGENNDVSYYFYYKNNCSTTLDYEFISTITKMSNSYVIYADKCTLPKDFMHKNNIVFKKIPRDITRF